MQIVTPNPPAPPPQMEPWVDAAAVGKHVGFGKNLIIDLAEKEEIPGNKFERGEKTYWRFKLSLVEAALIRRQKGKS